VCGRIEKDRINVPLAIPPLPKRNRIQWLYPLTALLGLFGYNKSNAQIADTSSSKSDTQNSAEKAIFEKNDSTGKVRQLYIEILLSGTDGSVLTDRKFDIRCIGIDSLKFTFENGLIKLPTDQFSKDSMEIIISDDNHYASVIVSPYSLGRYYVALGFTFTVKEYRTPLITEAFDGAMHIEISNMEKEHFNFQKRTLNEKIRYQQNQY